MDEGLTYNYIVVEKKVWKPFFFWHLIVLVLYFLINLELRDVLAESLIIQFYSTL